MSEYTEVEQPFLEQLSGLGWTCIDQGPDIPQDPIKSLTMVFVARMLRVSKDLNDYKILLINDRVDLEEQLAKTATLIGGRVNSIESTRSLREHLATDSSDINMVMVHKLMSI